MTAPATTPLSYNAYVQQLGVLAVALTQETGGVFSFVDPPLQTIVSQALNYAELRCQRDIDFMNARSSNNYALAAGVSTLSIPVDDFLIIDTVEVTQNNGSQVVNSTPLTPASREFIQNCYGGLAQASQPRFFAMFGDNFGDGANTAINILLGPIPNFSYPVRVTGVIRLPSLAQYAIAGVADTAYTYISEFLPDLLMMASMIYVSAFQRQFSSTSDDPNMGQSYEKQYKALLPGATSEENRKKFMASGWSSYSTPPAATPTR